MRERLMRGTLLLAVAFLLLAGCDAQSSGRATVPAGTPTPSPSAPDSPAPTPPPCEQAISQGTHVTQTGDFSFTDVGPAALAYPSVMLPDNILLTKPYQLHAADFAGSPITNAYLFEFVVCNVSQTRTHTLQAVSAKITSFVGYSGQLNTWRGCDGALDSHHQYHGPGECGGAGCPLLFAATFPADATTGAEVTARQDSSECFGYTLPATLPITVGPDKAVQPWIGLGPLPAAGRYTFTFGLQIDGQTIYSPASPVVLLAPGHSWTARACEQPAMLSQITPTDPETYYICPS